MAKPRLAGPPRRRVHPNHIVAGPARTALIERAAGLLQQGRNSKFEFEAACRHGIRAALVLSGHSWNASDTDAAGIVTAALDRIGAVRPTWEMGQPDYVIPRENCAWCGGEVDPEQLARGDRYCDTSCAKSAYVNRSYEGLARDDELRRRAYYMLARADVPRRDCRHCGKNFQPQEPETVFCSRTCAVHHRTELVPKQECQGCGVVFQPPQRGYRFCSVACAAATRRVLDDRTCEFCGTSFHPRDRSQRYCGHVCATAHHQSRLADRLCAVCGTSFHPKHTTALYCSEACHGVARYAKQKARRRKASLARSNVQLD